jgi:hypothetical protein
MQEPRILHIHEVLPVSEYYYEKGVQEYLYLTAAQSPAFALSKIVCWTDEFPDKSVYS